MLLPKPDQPVRISGKVFRPGISCAFRQWKAKSHCNRLHGYALVFEFEFECYELDDVNWVVDFGGLKGLKGLLEDAFDHKTLVAEDDPELATFTLMALKEIIDIHVVEAVGCEKFAEYTAIITQQWLKDAGYGDRVSVRSVKVSEHEANSATYLPY